ncbi:MAG: TRAP transporter small permease [Candidatus Hydrogenedens sp.]|jgi:TRAP-type C4-dicarboxylate transport system permease small subunit|nr:TRAP transporter small permease [Candidatus Hydrogenedens sp.]
MSISDHPLVRYYKSGSAFFWQVLRLVVQVLALFAGACILAMMCITCVDIVFRGIGKPIVGCYDLVRITGALAIACALPYTTAVKGHVAIEYFFLKLHRRGRIVIDSISRTVVMILFGTFAWQSMLYGNSLKRSGEVSLTLGIPLFWLSYAVALSLGITMLVTLHNLLHPGREMIKP